MKLKRLLNNGLFWAAASFLVSYFYFAISFSQYDDVWWDSASYIGISKYLYSGGESGIFEPMKPIILPVFLLLGFVLGADIVFFGKILILFFSLLSISFIYLLGKELYGERVGTIAAFAVFLNPLFFIFSFRIYTEMLSVCFILGSLYFMVKFSKIGNKRFLILTALFVALAFYSKYPYILMAVFLNIFLIISCIKKRNIKSIILFNASLLLFLLPFFILNYYFTGDSLYIYNSAQNYFRINLGHFYDWRAYPVPPLLIPTGNLVYFQAVAYLLNILLPFVLMGAYFIFKEKDIENYRRNLFLVILPMIILFLFFEIFYLKQERYILPVFSLFALMAGIALGRADKKLAILIIIIYGAVGLVWAGFYLNNPDERAYASFFSNPPVDLKCEKVATADPRSILRYDKVIFPYEVFDESWKPDRKPALLVKENPECIFYFSCAANKEQHYLLLEDLGYKRELIKDTGRCAYIIYKK